MIFYGKETKDGLMKKLAKAKDKARLRHEKDLERQEREQIKQQIRETNDFKKSTTQSPFLKGFKKGSIMVAKGVMATGKGLGVALTAAEENRRANEKSSKKKKKNKKHDNPFQFQF